MIVLGFSEERSVKLRKELCFSEVCKVKTESVTATCTCKLLKLKRLNVLNSVQAAPSHPGARLILNISGLGEPPLTLGLGAGKS